MIMAVAVPAVQAERVITTLGRAPMLGQIKDDNGTDLRKVAAGHKDLVIRFFKKVNRPTLADLFFRAVKGDASAGTVKKRVVPPEGIEFQYMGFVPKDGPHKGQLMVLRPVNEGRALRVKGAKVYYITLRDGPQSVEILVPLACGNITIVKDEPREGVITEEKVKPTLPKAAAPAAPQAPAQSQPQSLTPSPPPPDKPPVVPPVGQLTAKKSAWPWLVGAGVLLGGAGLLAYALVPHEPATVVNNTINNQPADEPVVVTVDHPSGNPEDEEPPSQSVPSNAPRLAITPPAPVHIPSTWMDNVLRNINIRVPVLQVKF